jgi:uncharacterized protein YecE (DUF72 family)
MVRASRIRVGTAGWSYSDWEGRVYPKPRPRNFHPLSWLSTYVDCVEVNSTFYGIPPPRNAERWIGLVEKRPEFRFLVKLHQEFTHGRWTTAPGERVRAFFAAVAPLWEADRLRAVLAQFPFYFRDEERSRERLERIAGAFPALPLVLELRSRTWFTDEGLAFLRGLGVGLAHVDLPFARDHPPERHPCVGEIGYIRLHGRNSRTWFDGKAGRDDRYDYLYRREELEAIVERIREVAAESRETFLVTNNHYGGQAVANALELRTMLDGHPALAPQVLRDAFPHLTGVTRGEGQQMLFS